MLDAAAQGGEQGGDQQGRYDGGDGPIAEYPAQELAQQHHAAKINQP